MKVSIRATREGAEHVFNIEAANKTAGLAYWRAHSMSEGFANPVVSIDGSEARAEKRSVDPGGAGTLMSLTDLSASRCQTCGVTTLHNSWDKSTRRVHRVGCRVANRGDLVTTMHIS